MANQPDEGKYLRASEPVSQQAILDKPPVALLCREISNLVIQDFLVLLQPRNFFNNGRLQFGDLHFQLVE